MELPGWTMPEALFTRARTLPVPDRLALVPPIVSTPKPLASKERRMPLTFNPPALVDVPQNPRSPPGAMASDAEPVIENWSISRVSLRVTALVPPMVTL